MQPELDSQLKDTDRAYLAGLFDGEGCANPTFTSKKHFSKREQKEKIYLWPRVQFVISGTRAHLQEIKRIVGFGGLYRQKTGVWDFRITEPKQVLNMVDIIFPYVKLKKEELLLLKNAALFMLKHKYRTRWTNKEKDFFNKNFVLPSQKLSRSRKKLGRRPKYKKDFITQKAR